MNILLFGGNSQRNKEWIHDVGEFLAPDFGQVFVHDYVHWDGRGDFINFDVELAKLAEETQGIDGYFVFAKSVGSVLTLMAISQGLLHPVRCVFAGLPIKLAEETNLPLPALLSQNTVPTTILQNTADPLAPYNKLVEYLGSQDSEVYSITELPGDTHSYDDYDKIRETLIS